MNTEADPVQPDWEALPPERLPRPNYFPSGLAMGTAFFFWGFVTSPVILAVGGGLFVASLAGWISEMRRERKHD
ncbi:MAG: cytochrome c oxidase subunit 4 [Chthoniobacterales bacterium]